MSLPLILVIHNVRSAHNVGALFRTADGAGVERVILTGYTPVPPEEGKLFYSPAENSFRKTALGAAGYLPWEKYRLFRHAYRKYQRLGYFFVALEQNKASIDYRDWKIEPLRRDNVQKPKLALVVGNEVRGLDARIVRQCDRVISLPMRGKKESLNVSVAGGIALYHLSATIEDAYVDKKHKTKTRDL